MPVRHGLHRPLAEAQEIVVAFHDAFEQRSFLLERRAERVMARRRVDDVAKLGLMPGLADVAEDPAAIAGSHRPRDVQQRSESNLPGDSPVARKLHFLESRQICSRVHKSAENAEGVR